MKEILFPIAYSEHSRTAYRYAQKLAQHFGSSITLAHIYETSGPLRTGGGGSLLNQVESQSLRNFADKEWDEQLEKLKKFAQDMNAKQYQDIPLDYIVTDGNIVHELLEIKKPE